MFTFRFARILACLLSLGLLALSAPLKAEDGLTIAAGAGYKRLVEEVCTAFTAKTSIPVQQVFGNMGQIVPQVKEGGNFDFILGDKSHLETTDLAFSGEQVIGKGKLVVVVAKESKVQNLNEITNPALTRIAIPDSKKAIYGHAATEYLQRKGLWDVLQPKLLTVGTVPQVSAYVVSGEVDMGFINLTEAMAIESKVAKVIAVDEQFYSSILIVAKRLQQSPHAREAEAFVAFLQSDEAKALAEKHGL